MTFASSGNEGVVRVHGLEVGNTYNPHYWRWETTDFNTLTPSAQNGDRITELSIANQGLCKIGTSREIPVPAYRLPAAGEISPGVLRQYPVLDFGTVEKKYM